MSLNKKKMVREIGRRTRIKNRDVQAVIEALIDVWTEELVSGGRIELEGFLLVEVSPTRKVGDENVENARRLRLRGSTLLMKRIRGIERKQS